MAEDLRGVVGFRHVYIEAALDPREKLSGVDGAWKGQFLHCRRVFAMKCNEFCVVLGDAVREFFDEECR